MWTTPTLRRRSSALDFCCTYMINAYYKMCECACVYLRVHQLCLCAWRLILIVAMETECCQRSPDSKRASLSLAPSLLVFFLLFLLFSSIPLSNLSPALLLLSSSHSCFLFFSFLKKIFYASHWGPPQFASLFVSFARPPPLFFSFLVPLISPPSIHPSRFSGPSWRVVCSWLLTQGPVISADEPPAISLG